LDNKRYGHLIPWLPLLGLVLPKLEYGTELVNALLNQDETLSRTTRFEDLVAAVICQFSDHLPGDKYRGLCITIHLEHGTSFFQKKDIHTSTIIVRIAELVEERREEIRKENQKFMETGKKTRRQNIPPLIFLITAREGHYSLIDELAQSPLMNDYLHLRNPSFRLMTHFVAHTFAYIGLEEWCVGVPNPRLLEENAEAIAKQVPESVNNYIYNMTFGNLHFVEQLCRDFVAKGSAKVKWDEHSKIVKLRFTRAVGLREEESKETLPEDITATAISTFESLEPAEQNVVKTASMCDEGRGFTTEILASICDLPFTEEVEHDLLDLCEQLVDKEIFTNVPTDNPTAPPRWMFIGSLMQRVARTLVVKLKRERSSTHQTSCSYPERCSPVYVDFNDDQLDICNRLLFNKRSKSVRRSNSEPFDSGRLSR